MVEHSNPQEVLSYHGGNHHRLYMYNPSEKPPNLYKCDFVEKVELVCTNSKQISEKTFECMGHSDGDLYYPSYHGADDDHKFWVYPSHIKLINLTHDFHYLPCNNCESKAGQKSTEVVQFRCLGHHTTCHQTGMNCSGTEQCPGHGTPDYETSFHGDFNNQNKFQILPKNQTLSNHRLHFRVNPCVNSKVLSSEFFSTKAEHQCLGHNYGQNEVRIKADNNLLLKIGVGILAVVAVVGIATITVAIIEHQKEEDLKPCILCCETTAADDKKLFCKEDKKSEAALMSKH